MSFFDPLIAPFKWIYSDVMIRVAEWRIRRKKARIAKLKARL